MQATEYLNQVKMIDRQIKNKKAEIEMLKSIATDISAAPSDCERVQSSGNSDKIGDAVVKICEAEEDLKCLIDTYIQKQKHISNSLDAIHDVNTYDVMHMRYIQLLPFEKIAERMDLTERWVKELNRRGLKSFQEFIDSSL